MLDDLEFELDDLATDGLLEEQGQNMNPELLESKSITHSPLDVETAKIESTIRKLHSLVDKLQVRCDYGC
jgi:hypothetical protein